MAFRLNRNLILSLMICSLLTACGAESTPAPTQIPSSPTSNFFEMPVTTPLPSATAKPRQVSPITPVPTRTITPVPIPEGTASSAWKSWPVIPESVDPSLQRVYERGLALGNDPNAFSIFGDCQARPGEFFGLFETDEEVFESLAPDLQETVSHFMGSFNRESSTAQDGTTPGSLLWIQWHRGEYSCTFSETPVECELRTHRPSFVIIQIGTHFESRNTEYLRRIILQLMDAGVVPILATKADNREKDERINRDMALLAVEYDLPLWNFWAAVSDLPNRGLYTRDDRPLQGDIYLTEEAAVIHRMTGLEVLDVVWRAVAGEN
ncbi:MAG TPA: hypothetical protein VFQ23_18805 [Anaerolineales bacterium]|nr:hypothetical protein [Anaerolineales bacterium]